MTILEECIEALRAEGCKVQAADGIYTVTAPSGRKYPFGAWRFHLWSYGIHQRTPHRCQAA